MVDNRSAGFFGIGGSFNFKSGDISGTAAKTQDDKMGQGGEYFAQQRREDDDENQDSQKYTDRSAQLRATLLTPVKKQWKNRENAIETLLRKISGKMPKKNLKKNFTTLPAN